MNKLRKQIRESFFNPVFQLLPILVFLVVDELFGMSIAWKIAFPVAMILLVYVFYVYNRIFTWHLIFTSIFILISLIAGVEYFFPISAHFHQILYEVVVLCFLLVFIVFRKPIQRIISKVISRLIPMTNNFNELYRFLYILLVVLIVYVSSVVLLRLGKSKDMNLYLHLTQYIYIGLLVFLIIYEILRVLIIRADLMKEEWWPIVSEQGKIIGSINHLTSLNDSNKYRHPIVRAMLIENGLILMQKRSAENLITPGLWDTAISNHVIVEETIDQCIERTANDRYGISNFKHMYLANYSIEVENEYQYAFLFVSCQQMHIKPNVAMIDQTKWWTQRQIEENLNSGIFTENFKVEYDLLKRSGLLETEKCECECRLKDTVYNTKKVQ